jgi:hypothetical protein
MFDMVRCSTTKFANRQQISFANKAGILGSEKFDPFGKHRRSLKSKRYVKVDQSGTDNIISA